VETGFPHSHFLQKLQKSSLIVQSPVQETENENLLLKHTHNLSAAGKGTCVSLCPTVHYTALHLRGLKTQMCAVAAGAYPEWKSTDVGYQFKM